MRSIVVIIAMLCFGSLHAQVDLSVRLDTNAILIGQQATLTLKVSYAGSAPEVIWPAIGDTLQRFVEVIDPGAIDTLDMNDRRVQVQEIIITSWDSGYYAIPPFEFKIDGEDRNTEAFLFAVNTVQVDTSAAPRDIKPIIEEPFSVKDWMTLNWPWVALIAILIGLAILIPRLRRKGEVDLFGPAPLKVIPAHITALEKLEHMKATQAWSNGTSKKYFTEVTDVLRVYLEDQFNIPAMEQTTAEIMEQMRYSPLPEAEKMALGNILMRADMAKFAKEDSTVATRENALIQAFNFVEQTKPKEVIDEE